MASTIPKKGTKYQGELIGITVLAALYLRKSRMILPLQPNLAKNKLNPSVVVVGNL